MVGIIILLVTIFIILAVTLTFMVYTIKRDSQIREREFNVKMAAAQMANTNGITSMKYTDLLSIIDKNMEYYVNQSILLSGVLKKTSEEKSLVINDILSTTCAQIECSISDKVKQALLNYITEEYLQTYIKDTTRVLLLYKIENPRK